MTSDGAGPSERGRPRWETFPDSTGTATRGPAASTSTPTAPGPASSSRTAYGIWAASAAGFSTTTSTPSRTSPAALVPLRRGWLRKPADRHPRRQDRRDPGAHRQQGQIGTGLLSRSGAAQQARPRRASRAASWLEKPSSDHLRRDHQHQFPDGAAGQQVPAGAAGVGERVNAVYDGGETALRDQVACAGPGPKPDHVFGARNEIMVVFLEPSPASRRLRWRGVERAAACRTGSVQDQLPQRDWADGRGLEVGGCGGEEEVFVGAAANLGWCDGPRQGRLIHLLGLPPRPSHHSTSQLTCL